MKGVHHFDRGFDGAYWIRGQEGDKPLLKGDLPPRMEVDGAKTRVDPRLANTRLWQFGDPAFVDQSRLGLGGGPLLRAHGADGEPLAGGKSRLRAVFAVGGFFRRARAVGFRRNISWAAMTHRGTTARR